MNSMKKSLLYGMLLTTALMSSCKGDYDDWAVPQGYDAEEASYVTVTATAAPAIDMNNVIGENVNLFTVTVGAPEGMEVTGYEVEIGESEDNKTTLTTTQDGQIAASELVAVTESYFGKAPVERTLKSTVVVYLKKDGQAFYSRSNVIDNLVTLITPDISENYYLVGDMFTVGDEINGWSTDGMKKFNHSDINIYDDPVFTVQFEVTAANQYWKIIPQSNIDNDDFWANPGVVGVSVDGDASLSGFLVSENANAGKIEEPGVYTMTINMMDGTYNLVKAPNELYYVGDIGGWNTFFPMVETESGISGFYYIAKADNVSNWGFKFTSTPDWDNPQYGAGADAGTIALDGGNIDLPEGFDTGFYKIDVDTKALTFSVTPITIISLIGSAVNGDTNWGTDYDMTFNTETLAWEGTFELTAGEFKFRANHDWTYSWGGPADALTSNNGANLVIETAGTYKITFKPNCDGKGLYTIE